MRIWLSAAGSIARRLFLTAAALSAWIDRDPCSNGMRERPCVMSSESATRTTPASTVSGRPSERCVMIDCSASLTTAVRATVTDLAPHGHQVRVHTAYLSADITPAALAELALAPGDEVVLTVKASEVAIYAG